MSCRRVLVALMLAATASAAQAQGPTLDRIKESGVLRIGYRADARPHSYLDPQRHPAGYVVELCREVANGVRKAIAPAPLKIDYFTVTAANRFESVQKGAVDLLCEPSSMTLSRRAAVDFSIPTFVDGAGVLSKRGVAIQRFEDFAGKRIGVLAETTTEQVVERALRDLAIKADTQKVKDHREGARLVASGALDAYVADRSILSMLIYEREMPQGLQIGPRYFSYETYALAMPRGDTEFRLLVDRTLAELFRSGRIEDLIRRAFGGEPDELLRLLIAINALPE